MNACENGLRKQLHCAKVAGPRITKPIAAREEGTTTKTAGAERAGGAKGKGKATRPAPLPLQERDISMMTEEEGNATRSAAAAAAAAAQVVAGAAKCVDVAAAATSAASGDGEHKLSAAKVRMPQNYVAAILALNREPSPSPEYLERLSPEDLSRVIFGDWDYDDPESVQYLL
ncbi:hypothetical protein E2562_006079 [Oryza meyeriana var. granulata]|uniref:Uncharacterized protein n=1 Tax=Oryza meyeriana var. granulata TaxID=110450 RepID=A0A6G1EVI4_9ORYZ|nr:hypothetical protein E2562_006079 [Oryza meyeriana var. granulata]